MNDEIRSEIRCIYLVEIWKRALAKYAFAKRANMC